MMECEVCKIKQGLIEKMREEDDLKDELLAEAVRVSNEVIMARNNVQLMGVFAFAVAVQKAQAFKVKAEATVRKLSVGEDEH